MTHPFRFALAASTVTNGPDFVEVAKKAEDLGYSAIATADHLDNQLAPLIALTGAAMATTTLRLNSLVLCNDYRHPGMVAKEAATLDQLSGGRLELGMGAGWMKTDYEQLGMPYDRPSVRIARLGESVEIVKGLLNGDSVNFAGDFYSIAGLVGTPLPHGDAIPLMLAGGGKKMLTLAAQHADIIGVNPGLAAGVIDERAGATATPNATDQKLQWIRDAAGERFDEIELQTRIHLAAINDDRSSYAEMMAPLLGITTEEALSSPHALVGTVDQCIETIHMWRERWGISYISWGAEALEEMAPVVAVLSGQ